MVKISALTELSDVDSDDYILAVDASANATKRALHKNMRRVVNDQTGTDYTLVTGDQVKVIVADNASANTIKIDTNANAAIDIGAEIPVIQKGAGATTITALTTVTLNGVTAGSGAITAQWDRAILTKIAADAWALSGDAGAVS